MSKSQVDALCTILKLLEKAYQSSSAYGNRRDNRLAFLSGAKGTGKSSVVATLRQFFDDPMLFRMQLNAFSEDATMDHSRENQQKLTTTQRNIFHPLTSSQSIYWLHTLTLDPLPPGSNLLGAVLSRIEHSITEIFGHDRVRGGHSANSNSLNRARIRLQNLKHDAISAIEGNLHDHKQFMSPHEYSNAASEVESNKTKLQFTIDDILDTFIDGASVGQSIQNKNGIFVAVIDDLDLRPSRAIEAIKLAHNLCSRRLFFLFLGSLPDLDQALYHNVQGEFIEILHNHNSDSVRQIIEKSANEISSSLLRKLIPQSQRITISSMSVSEAMRYTVSSNSHSDQTQRTGKAKSLQSPQEMLRTCFLPLQFEFAVSGATLREKLDTPTRDRIDKRQKKFLRQHLIPRDGSSDGNVFVFDYFWVTPDFLLRHDFCFSRTNFLTARARKEVDDLKSAESLGKNDADDLIIKSDFLRGPFEPGNWFQFADLIDAGNSHANSSKDEPIYDGARILSSTPRHIGDFLALLESAAGEHDHFVAAIKRVDSGIHPEEQSATAPRLLLDDYNRITTGNLSEWLATIFKGLIDEDGDLTVPVQARLKACVEKHNQWELTPPMVFMEAIPGDRSSFRPAEKVTTKSHQTSNSPPARMIEPDHWYFQVDIARILRHQLFIERVEANPDGSSPEPLPALRLGVQTGPAFKLMHDFFVFSGAGVITEPVRQKHPHLIACTSWSSTNGISLTVSWLKANWTTFWRQDVFSEIWNSVFERIRDIKRQPSDVGEDELCAFCFIAWFTTTIQTLSALPGDLGLAEDTESRKSTAGGTSQAGDHERTRFSSTLPTEIFGVESNYHESRQRWVIKDTDKGTAQGAERAKSQEAQDSDEFDDFIRLARHRLERLFTAFDTRICRKEDDMYTQEMMAKIIELGCLILPESGFLMALENCLKKTQPEPTGRNAGATTTSTRSGRNKETYFVECGYKIIATYCEAMAKTTEHFSMTADGEPTSEDQARSFDVSGVRVSIRNSIKRERDKFIVASTQQLVRSGSLDRDSNSCSMHTFIEGIMQGTPDITHVKCISRDERNKILQFLKSVAVGHVLAEKKTAANVAEMADQAAATPPPPQNGGPEQTPAPPTAGNRVRVPRKKYGKSEEL